MTFARTDERGVASPTDERSSCGVGVVVDLEGDGGHDVVADGLELLANLEHRGTTGAEENTGDGAGILLRTPRAFLADEVPMALPDTFAVGSLFLPPDDDDREQLVELVEDTLAEHGLDVVHWRTAPTDDDDLGETALASEPAVRQPIVVPADGQDVDAFDRDLYVARRAVERTVESSDIPDADRFYVCSLDRQTVVYKGLLRGDQLADYYPDLTDERVRSTFAMVHARFSTNTLGAWHLAHPYRRIVHNGEFNTIRGNVNWMRARETDLAHEALDDHLETLTPVVADPEQSDTASVDNALELLLETRSLPHALRMLVPEAWRGPEAEMTDERREWYDFHASLVEPWDGPALVCATDGERVGAVLDRNGLRPCRYDLTTDGRLVMASEAGALDLDPATVAERGRLKPGQLLLADPEEGRIVPDEEVFDGLTDERYGRWVAEEQVRLESLVGAGSARESADATLDGASGRSDHARSLPPLRARQALYGYTHDELDKLLGPMAADGKDPVGSMGDDTPLSVLSSFDRPLFTYFKQLFAQVTNPPLDYIRESLVTSLETRLGRQRNLLGESSEHARQLVADSPVLSDAALAAIRDMDGDAGSDGADRRGLSSATVDVTFPAATALADAVERVRDEAREAIEDGADVVVLSDRRAGPERLPVPSLLATAAVHHHLVREGLRARAGLVVESADPRQVHHVAALVGYGAGAVNPYLAYETIADLVAGPEGADEAAAVDAYVAALEDGLLKTMAKMGISTVESYRGAQIFEAVGLDGDFVAEYFEGTVARTGGIGIEAVEADLRERHAVAFDDEGDLARQGEFRFSPNGIHHHWRPTAIRTLQEAVREGDYAGYEEFASMVDEGNGGSRTLRGRLEFRTEECESIPLADVEPVAAIVERFSTAAMSLGSLSPEAHETNAVAMSRVGGKSNTGEGGEPPERFGTERECPVKQVASGRFGVTATYLASADELQIKMAQGSKPGEGGHLPGGKVDEMIAHVRHSTPGVGLISPPPQHDIYSIEDLKQLIYDLKSANDAADVNVKLVAEEGVGTIAAGVAKAKADVVHISGHSGGTGASPRTSIKNAGVPWELGLAEAQQLLVATGLRDRVRLAVDGGLRTGRDVAVATLLGAEEFVFGTASLVTMGCVMARQCHANTCPVGIATQDEELRGRFPGDPDHVVNYVTFVARQLREIMADLGVATVDELVGRVDLLRQRTDVDHPRARTVDLSGLLAEPGDGPRRKVREQDHGVDEHFDRDLLPALAPAIERGEPVNVFRRVGNEDRSVGALLSNRVSRRHGVDGLPAGTVSLELAGTAGQSLGAFLQSGVEVHLVGGANDHVGKGLSGGTITVAPPPEAGYGPADVAVGNVALYGATDGELYVNGRAGERFAVRNSGAMAVVEGVGDHGCEYMTGGAVAVLGAVGKNFAAGMSGGVAYVLDGGAAPDETPADLAGALASRANTGMVTVESALTDRDRRMLRRLLENHVAHTGSERAAALLADWEAARDRFVRVMPEAYSRAVEGNGREDVRDAPPAAAPWTGVDDVVPAETVSD